MKPPRPRQEKRQRTHHGIRRVDEFAWLRADNWREVLRDPAALPEEIRRHLEAENDYTHSLLSPVVSLTEKLLAEMKARIPEEDESVPLADGDYAYWQLYHKGEEHPSFLRRQRDQLKGDKGEAQLLLNAHKEAAALAEKADFFRLGHVAHSEDHRFLAWSADVSGGEYYTIHIRDLESGSDIDKISSSDGDCFWVGEHIIYIHMDEHHRPDEVRCHRLGTAQSEDHLIFRNRDAAFFLSAHKSLSREYIFIDSYDHDSSEVFVLAAKDICAAPQRAKPRLVKKRQGGVEYHLAHDAPRQQFFILTNESAIDFKIMTAPCAHPDQWQELIAHQQGIYILEMAAFENYLARLERADGLPRLIIRDLRTDQEYRRQLSAEPHDLSMDEGFAYANSKLRLHFSSLRQSEQVFDFDMKSRQQCLRKTQEVGGGYDADDYISERHFARGADGAEIPISLIYHRATPPNKDRPLWLYGYGAYGITIPARFSSARLSLIDRGWTFAIAHIRGGSAKGRSWYQQGKLEHKTNSFGDFIACAEHLIARGIARGGFITAQGGSAGGMLMGAIANQAPDLFRAIIAQVPFVDVLSTMLDDALPLTPPEWLEWGNPISDSAAYRRIAAYSPYDNVAARRYPWILATSGLSDPRVGYWEAAKWVARLREAQRGQAPICLKTEMAAGHGGQSGRFRSLDEIANIYSFALLAHGLSDTR